MLNDILSGHKNKRHFLGILAFVIFLVLSACRNEQIRVAMVSPSVQKGFGHFLDIRNCEGETDLRRSLAAEVNIDKNILVADQATAKDGDEVIEIPLSIKLMIESNVEKTYREVYQDAITKIEQTELFVPVGKIRMYNVKWEIQTYSSTVYFDINGDTFEAAYTYELIIPQLAGFMEISCTG
jgi:hypothetical protein